MNNRKISSTFIASDLKLKMVEIKYNVPLYSAQLYHNLITSCIKTYLQDVFYDKLFSDVFPFRFLCAGILHAHDMIYIKHYTAIV